MRVRPSQVLGLLLVGAFVAAGGAARAQTPPDPLLLKELREQVQRYEAAARDFQRDVRRIVDLNFEDRKTFVTQNYEGDLKTLEEQERSLRGDAIARFEEFLRRYPDHPIYSPDAMFRLAELYFERSNDNYLRGLESYEERLAEFESGSVPQRPEEPVQDYSQTIRLFQDLTRRFPSYRLVSGAYYLLGYCLAETGQEDEGNAALTYLVQNYPESPLVAEAWMRIGEHNFNNLNLPGAVAAYAKALEHPESPYYDRALYKLAWTYYRMDDFDSAIKQFDRLVQYADEQAAKGVTSSADLRAEAIQYLAISLAEEDWDGDGVADAEQPVQRAFRYLTGEKPHQVDILRRLGDVFFENTRYESAMQVYQYLLSRYPFDESNPEVHTRIVVCLEQLQRLDEAYAERARMTAAYQEGSEWYKRNEGNRKAVKLAREVSENALIAAAVYHHDRAQVLKDDARAKGDPALLEQSRHFYEIAAGNYQEYLRRYPHSKNAYELNFYYADCLYYSFRFLDAARQYVVVRDAAADGKYREEAALSAVQSLEQYVDQLVQEGRLPYKATAAYDPAKDPEARAAAAAASSGAETEKKLPEAQPLPEELLELVQARDAYVAAGLVNKDDPTVRGRLAFKGGELYYRFNQFDEARKRFEAVIAEFPKEQVASLAASYIIESYRLTEDWQKMAEWSERVASLDLGTPEDRRKLKEEVTTLKVGALFRKAESLFQEERYEEAAVEYVALVNQNPGNQFADRALNNAAVAYEKVGKYESAMKLYERVYKEYPDRQFAEYALYRVAVNSERFFAWPKAIESYLALANRFPKSERRADALANAALLQESLQQYDAAAASYLRYVADYPQREDAAQVLYQVGVIYEKKQDWPAMYKAFDRFLQRFGRSASHNDLVMQALAKMAERREAEGNWREASKLYDRILREFRARGMQPGTPPAVFAAKAQFLLTDRDFRAYEATNIAGSIAQQGKTIQRLKGLSRALSERYAMVFDYKSLDWTLAAYFRIASLFQKFAEKLYNAPVPGAIASDAEASEMYRMELEDVAVPIEDEAVRRFETAFGVARENHINNEWTRRILAVLNKYKPADYPMLKEERRQLLEEPIYGLPPQAELPPPPAAAPSPPEETPAAAPAASAPAATPPLLMPAAAPAAPGGQP